MHKVPYVGHPIYQKTITLAKTQYYWPGMKKQVVDFIARCLKYQKVKARSLYWDMKKNDMAKGEATTEEEPCWIAATEEEGSNTTSTGEN
jgi:hypothetical protein